jgi:hypothetical protein
MHRLLFKKIGNDCEQALDKFMHDLNLSSCPPHMLLDIKAMNMQMNDFIKGLVT